jgi:hypothetical protein
MFERFAVRLSAFLCLNLLGAGVSFADLPAPVAIPVSVVTTENTAALVTFVGQHTTGGSFTYEVKTQPSHGHLSAANGDHVTYTPDNAYVGDDSFTYSTTDSVGESLPATVSITVAPAAPRVVSLPTLSDHALGVLAGLLVTMVLFRKRTA